MQEMVNSGRETREGPITKDPPQSASPTQAPLTVLYVCLFLLIRKLEQFRTTIHCRCADMAAPTGKRARERCEAEKQAGLFRLGNLERREKNDEELLQAGTGDQRRQAELRRLRLKGEGGRETKAPLPAAISAANGTWHKKRK